MPDYQKEVLQKGLDVYGEQLQQVVVMEELSELQKEVSKSIRGKGDRDHLIEEIADVMICIETLRLIYNIEGCEISEIQLKKLKRLECRIKKENEDVKRHS